MKAMTLKQTPCGQFFARLSRDSLFEGFVSYLALRIAEQQKDRFFVIAGRGGRLPG